ncbi:hypothetical protein JDV02_010875 [Purpureocillium takamizusanense]|uniref:Uncharacterized protein n=1 Tax=Purpureocillium takamizusanense TaxID=2060973 RepID=A0A9Q8QMK2_9HYPO|nr:uncharacterized protein JDV02_010875 [Purpureocillium takamizusanense]UNI22480.1 hypothetical protein JDV02_010875 [Purpureocillium takamizusanense]
MRGFGETKRLDLRLISALGGTNIIPSNSTLPCGTCLCGSTRTTTSSRACPLAPFDSSHHLGQDNTKMVTSIGQEGATRSQCCGDGQGRGSSAASQPSSHGSGRVGGHRVRDGGGDSLKMAAGR